MNKTAELQIKLDELKSRDASEKEWLDLSDQYLAILAINKAAYCLLRSLEAGSISIAKCPIIDGVLPLGKDGCDKCSKLDYYCDECTIKIYDHLNQQYETMV